RREAVTDLIERLRKEEGRRAVRLGNSLTTKYAHREDVRAMLREAADALEAAQVGGGRDWTEDGGSPAVTTNKEVQRYDNMGCPEEICRVDTMYESDDGDFVLYEDYEALQAECERLVEVLECMIIGACAVAVPHNGERGELQDAVSIARKALAADRKQGDSND